jgi:hypothetical protein
MENMKSPTIDRTLAEYFNRLQENVQLKGREGRREKNEP